LANRGVSFTFAIVLICRAAEKAQAAGIVVAVPRQLPRGIAKQVSSLQSDQAFGNEADGWGLWWPLFASFCFSARFALSFFMFLNVFVCLRFAARLRMIT